MKHVNKAMQAALEIAATVCPDVYRWDVRQGRNSVGTPFSPELTTESYANADLAQWIKKICDKYDCRYYAAPVQIGTTFSGKSSLATKYTIVENI